MSREASAKRISGLVISAPEWFQRDDFCQWLHAESTASWIRNGETANEFSDAFTIFDHGSGPDEDDIPSDIWQEICRLAEEQDFVYGVIWIKPV